MTVGMKEALDAVRSVKSCGRSGKQNLSSALSDREAVAALQGWLGREIGELL